MHCIVPGGGLSKNEYKFIKTKDKYFIPIKILSRVFKNKFLGFLKEAYCDKKLEFHGDSLPFSSNISFYGLIDNLYKTD